MIRWKLGFVAVVAVLALASTSSAATVTLTPTVQATYDNAGVLIGNSFIKDGQPHIYRVGIMASIQGLGANESFGLVGYDVALQGAGLTRNTVSVGGATTGLTNPKPNYVADSPTTPYFISASGNPLTNYYTGGNNGDLGSLGTDLIGMLTAVDSANIGGLEDDQGVHVAVDPRTTIGTSGGGTRLGVVYVKWDGVTSSTFTLTSPLFSTVNSATHSFSNTAAATVVPAVFVPEPSTIVLASMACVGLAFAARRRRSA